MIGNIFSSLRDTGALPWVAALIAVIVASFFVSRAPSSRAVSSNRLKDLVNLREGNLAHGRYRAGNMKRVVEEGEEPGGIPGLDWLLGGLSGVAGELPLLGAKDRIKVRELLARGGIRREDALGLFMTAKIVSAVLGIVIAFAVVTFFHLFATQALLKVAVMLVGAIAGSLLPEFVLKQKAAGRMKEIVRNLPDALDLMVICTEAGLSLDPTVERVARELRLSAPDLAREMAVMSQEMRLLPKREMALENFIKRNDYREVRSLMSTLVQTLRYGTSLAQSLRVLAAESRSARMLAVEEKAARLPAMMSIPLICFMLPAVFLVIGGPAISQLMKNVIHH